MNMNAVAVFCGSKSGKDPLFATHTIELGRLIADCKLKLIYGGGSTGLMGLIEFATKSLLNHDVVAVASVEDVQAEAADQDIIASATGKHIRAVAANENVVAIAAVAGELNPAGCQG